MISDNQYKINTSRQINQSQKSILEYQNAIVALQSGHFPALDTLVDKHSPTDKAYKDKLWAIFRTASTQLRLNAHVQEIKNTEKDNTDERQYFDDYHSLYTEVLDEEDCKEL